MLKNDIRGNEGYPKMDENPKIFMIERFRLQKSCWLVKVINTANGGEALILSMYTNYFDGTVCIEVCFTF